MDVDAKDPLVSVASFGEQLKLLGAGPRRQAQGRDAEGRRAGRTCRQARAQGAQGGGFRQAACAWPRTECRSGANISRALAVPTPGRCRFTSPGAACLDTLTCKSDSGAPTSLLSQAGCRPGDTRVQPTNTADPTYFHKVVDCQWACPAHTPVPEYIRLIAQGRYSDAYMVNWVSQRLSRHPRPHLRPALRAGLPARPRRGRKPRQARAGGHLPAQARGRRPQGRHPLAAADRPRRATASAWPASAPGRRR